MAQVVLLFVEEVSISQSLPKINKFEFIFIATKELKIIITGQKLILNVIFSSINIKRIQKEIPLWLKEMLIVLD